MFPTLWSLLACSAAADVPVVPLVTGVPEVTDIQTVPGHDALVVLTKGGTAHRVDWPSGDKHSWLTVDVRTGSEMGLLGVAFAKDFEQSGIFYLHTNPSGGERRSRVSRWKVDPATLDGPQRLNTVLELEQPYGNHDGGQLQIGPDGMLYVAFGDGGSANDPLGSGQDRDTWLGAILRIDVSDAAGTYTVPDDNPFVGKDGKPEIWAWGLRNPWRFILLDDGRAVIGDVGQNEVEEVTVGGAGANHGWNTWEGDRCFREPCTESGFTMPIATYTHDQGQSITGGVIPTSGPHAGEYVYGDFVSGRLWALDLATKEVTELGRVDAQIATFGLAPDGSALLGDYGGGRVLRLGR